MSQLSLFALAVCGAVTAVASTAPPCDTTKTGKKVCADFCNYKCGFYNTSLGDTGKPTNITVYRLTPKNVTGLLNKNTGDAYGDVSFVLSKKNLTQYCLHKPHGEGCDTDSEHMDLYGTFVVEVDGQWGPYQMCNPADGWDTSDWRCGQNCLHPSHANGCPRDGGQWGPAKNGSGWMGYSCWCNRTYKTAGRENAPGSWAEYYPKHWPPQCSTGDFYPTTWDPKAHGRCATGTTYKVLKAWSEASALTMACKECAENAKCTGWRLSDDGKSAEVFQGKIAYVKCSDPSRSSFKHIDSHNGGRSWFGIGNIGGYWYSTTNDGGECQKGMPIGTDGCTWRLVETKAYKNATCVDTFADQAIEEYGKMCFDTCPFPLNRTTDCYLDCYRNVIMGDASLNITKPPPKLFVDPWVTALKEDDPSRGGCPPVKPGNHEAPLEAIII